MNDADEEGKFEEDIVVELRDGGSGINSLPVVAPGALGLSFRYSS